MAIVGAVLFLSGLGGVCPAGAQGRADILWMKGLGHYAFSLFPSTDGKTSIKVARVQNVSAENILVRRVNNADNTLLNTLMFNDCYPYDVIATPDCLHLLILEDTLKLRSVLDGSIIWSLSLNDSPSSGSLKMSRDGKYFAYLIPGSHQLKVRRVADGALMCSLGYPFAYDFAPNSSEIVSLEGLTASNTVPFLAKFYAIPSGSFKRKWNCFGYGSSRGYSPDGRFLALSSGDAGTSTTLFNVADGSVAQGFDAYNSPYGYHNPTWIGSSFYLNQVRNGEYFVDSWTTGSSTRTELWTFPSDFNAEILNMARSFDGHLAIMGDRLTGTRAGEGGDLIGGYIRYIDPVTGALLREDDSSGATIRSVAWTSDGNAIVTAGDDGVVRCYDRASKSLRWRYSNTTLERSQSTITISRDDLKVAVSPGLIGLPVNILSMANGSLLQTIADPNGDGISSSAFSPDGLELVTASPHTRLWRLSDGALLNTSYGGQYVAFSPNGQYVALTSGYFGVYLLSGSDLSYVGLGSGTGNLGYGNTGSGVSFSPDSTNLAFSQILTLSCFRVSDMNRQWIRNQDSASVTIGPAVFSPDGHIVTGYRNSSTPGTAQLQFLDPLTGAVVKYFDVETGYGGIVPAISSNGKYLAYGLTDTTLVVAKAPDLLAPSTTVSISGFTITLTATDAGSGVAATYYTLDGGSLQKYARPFTVATIGAHTLVYWSVDNAGNTETQHNSLLTAGIGVSLAVVGASGPVGTKVTVTSTLKRADNNTALTARTLTYTLDGTALGTSATNGSGTASFSFTVPDSIGNHTLTVKFTGDTRFLPGTGSTQVLATAPLLSTLTLSPANVTGGMGSTGTVKLTGSTAQDTVVTLSTANSAATAPASITVLQGQNTATFSLTTVAVATNTTVPVSASLDTVTLSANLTVKPAVYASFTLTPNPVRGGNSVTGTVTMSGPVAADTVVSLTNTNVKASLQSSSVTIPAGMTSISFVLTTRVTTANVGGFVKATVGAVTKSVTLIVTP